MPDLSLTSSIGAIAPDDTFRYELESKRNLAIAREDILVAQIAALNTDLASVRKVIERCNIALQLDEPMLTGQAPTVVVTKPAVPPAPPESETPPESEAPSETPTSEDLQAAIHKVRNGDDGAPIPGFLNVLKPALDLNGGER